MITVYLNGIQFAISYDSMEYCMSFFFKRNGILYVGGYIKEFDNLLFIMIGELWIPSGMWQVLLLGQTPMADL